uniref:DRY_EERY domain-containing protein n=1 Tax=Panagrellus redivivus TaxID=6233 RepID=A0A7E4V8I0_PANRE
MSANLDLGAFEVAKRRYAYNLEQIADKYSKMEGSLTEWDLETDQIFLTPEGANVPTDQVKREIKATLFNATDFGFAALSTPCDDEEMSDSRRRRVLQHNERFARRLLKDQKRRSMPSEMSSEESEDGEEDGAFFRVSDADATLDREYEDDFVVDEHAGPQQSAVVLNDLFSPDELEEFYEADETETDDLSKTLPARFSDDDDPAPEADPTTEADKKECDAVSEDRPIASRLRRRATTVSYSDVKRRKTK